MKLDALLWKGRSIHFDAKRQNQLKIRCLIQRKSRLSSTILDDGGRYHYNPGSFMVVPFLFVNRLFKHQPRSCSSSN